MSLGDELQKYSYSYLMTQALARVPNTVDKREGSIIYDALAPACYVLAQFYLDLYNLIQETYVLTATGEWLDNRVMEFGITRSQATAAVKRADFEDSAGNPVSVPIGSRFSTISTTVPLFYVVTDTYKTDLGVVVPGAFLLTCETEGTVGHEYTGNIIPIDYLPSIAVAEMTTTVIPGQAVETDEALRQRYIDKVNSRPFGGNIAQYREMILDIDGIGDCQIYPVWDGGGTVKISIVGSDLLPVTPEFIAIVQDIVDPNDDPELQGTGVGTAPIGHLVTLATGTQKVVNIATNITLMSGYTIEMVQGPVETALEAYFVDLRESWGVKNDFNQYILGVYISGVNAAMLTVQGVANVTGTTLNGVASDLALVETSATQEVPTLGEVTLND